MSVVDGSFDHPMKLEERASMPLAGGIMQYGYQCGMLWGAALAAGAQAYRLFGPGPQAETAAILAAQRLVSAFRSRNKSMDCVDITHLSKTASAKDLAMHFLVKGGVIGCFRMAANYAPLAFKEINAAFSETDFDVPSPPLSCASILAKKMGVSEMHAVMAAGFAGGIGLSGGACGALGAAIWISGLNSGKEDVSKIVFAPPAASDLVDRFVESADYEFECAKIVGRKFETVGEHAEHMRNGGCSKIMAALTSS
jgi:hypothetical protein